MNPRPPSPHLISVIVPILNEDLVLGELIARLVRLADSQDGMAWEFLLVDDGSTDGTPEILASAAAEDARFKAITLSRNFGHQEAITAGLDFAAGDLVAIIDGDLQDPPEMIPDMIAHWRQGADVVYAVRQTRKESIAVRLCYRVFYRVLKWCSRTPIPLDAGDCCLLDRRVVDVMGKVPDRSRFVRGLRAWVGFHQVPYPYDRDARFAGRSKYSLSHLLVLAFDGLVSFSELPLRLGMLAGLTLVAMSLLYALVAAAVAILSWETRPQGFATLVVAMTFLSGIQLLVLSILAEYVLRIFKESKGRPLYIVKDMSNLDARVPVAGFGVVARRAESPRREQR